MRKIFTLVLFSFIAFASNAQTVLVQTNFDLYQTSGFITTYPNTGYYDGFYISWNDTTTATRSFYTGASTSCGLSCNAYKFGRDSSTIISPSFQNADSVSFMMKGNGTYKANKFKVYGSTDSTNWTLIHSFDSIPVAKQTYTLAVDPTYTNLKFYYQRDSTGYNVGFDDVVVFSNSTIGIKNISSSAKISLFPNPSKGIVNVDLNGNKLSNASIIVSDLLGNELKKISLKNSETGHQLNISEFQDGVYFVKVKSDAGEFVQRVILKK